MTPPSRAAIEERLRKATLGPWFLHQQQANADLIAHAPTDIAFLLFELDRLGKELEKMRNAAKPLADRLAEVEEEYADTDEGGRLPDTFAVMVGAGEIRALSALATQLSATEDGEGK